ncbi:hypothetical protein BC826DRAFT_908571 [Russula brevipes]|nr:hypothetical protein BC826DRAFT_908571 [Russula brevipes]
MSDIDASHHIHVPKAVLYYNPQSAWSIAALLALEEKGYGKDEVDLKLVDLSKGENFSPSFLRLNPQGTVPTLVVPFENTLSPDMESRYRAITDTDALIAFLDKSRSTMSRTHTTSSAPAPALSPATVALSSAAKSIITLVHSGVASPDALFCLNARDLPALRAIAPSVSAFLKGRKQTLERHLAENESKEVRVSEKTNTFWLEKKRAIEALLIVLDQADKSDSELSESGRTARQEYFDKSKAIWEVDLAVVLNNVSKELVGPYALGEQISIVDVHLAAWLRALVTLSGGSIRDSGTAAIARLEEYVGGRAAFTKDMVTASATRTMDSDGSATAPTTTTSRPRLAVLWDALATRSSWQQVFGADG